MLLPAALLPLLLLAPQSVYMLQAGSSPSTDAAAQAKAAATSASDKVQAATQSSSMSPTEGTAKAKAAILHASETVQAAAQSTGNALAPQQLDPPSSGRHQQHTDAQSSASEPSDSPSAFSNAAYGSAVERAKHALQQRISMVTEKYREDDCTCFDTTLGCLLKVIMLNHAH